MMSLGPGLRPALALAALAALSGCLAAHPLLNRATARAQPNARADMARQEKFQEDRAAILAMAGEFHVTFDFTETVPFVARYEPKARYRADGDEMVRVIADEGDFISLQHILVVGEDERRPVKHWRQDWVYEPESVLVFVGGNAWEKRALSSEESRGRWAQIVYQVDDAPRYGALAAWRHENGMSEWTPPAELRPLPRRDATKRDDYHAIYAVNRHAITPDGWVHEQDNSKLILTGAPQVLVREVGVNTYVRTDDVDFAPAEDYWAKTEAFWAAVRAEWAALERENPAFGLTIQGEPEALYMKILELAGAVNNGETSEAEAIAAAKTIIADYTTTNIGSLSERLGQSILDARRRE